MNSIKKKALVTGASRGIGRLISDRLLTRGFHVTGLARHFSDEQLKSAEFTPCSIDLSNLAALPARIDELRSNGNVPSVLILNAGTGLFGSLEEFSYKQISTVMDLNFTSHAYIVRSFLPEMKKAGTGNIIFIGSDAGLRGSKKGSIYCASKFAIRGFAQALRAECSKSNIAVSIINPGMINTEFYDGQDFEPGLSDENSINPGTVPDCIDFILDSGVGTVMDEINLSPLKHVIHFKKKD